ncbi:MULTISPECIES: DUF4199 family protein [Psychroflexus]|uniref:DUF4199 domain-containing protein n=1 Tax=Psychroflexus halocasei TaxID=908615 RepID=A0A1H4BKG0_9FLAO|nr:MULTISPECIES: DUF4199 family protein [Psychroflexus]PJX27520.1 DUF4199 domain-containing protein [Psychroflexus sp. S27]SEA48586.1 Protein of unknown function [Psychroflexus halocasei]
MNRISISIRYGTALAASLIAYFLILSLFDAHTQAGFSTFNMVITAFAIYDSIRSRKHELRENFKYENGVVSGLITGIFGTILFTVFMSIYTSELNPDFLDNLTGMMSKNLDVNPLMFSFVVAIMGFATTVVMTLTFMQLFKKSIHKK